jgi:hypothetical protein
VGHSACVGVENLDEACASLKEMLTRRSFGVADDEDAPVGNERFNVGDEGASRAK